ncbi:MAG: biotin--[acetyl-CoA-carboxylase] ligase [Pirellulales bacterium]|nr:biotin--[acetyl-CoA-carboxylase] ligase [Pirellulales bacterium]
MDLQHILSETFVASAEHHEVLGSTNDLARRRADEGLPFPRLITAEHQTSGRGRGANVWWTGQGSLAMSLLLPSESIPEEAGRSILISLVTAVAVVDTLRPIVETQPLTGGSVLLGLHWPNDVFLSGRKLAGILIEVLPNRAHVIGIGINTNNTAADAPDNVRPRVITLRDATGVVCDHVELLIGLLNRMELGLRALSVDPNAIAQAANERCLQQGQILSIQMGKKQLTGRCLGIAPDGALLIDTPDGPRPCHSGVVR